MATTSIADKLAKLEKKIAKRQATIAEEQTQLCKRYVDNWYCDTYTIQHELKDAMMLITKPERTDSEKEKAVGKD